jgi:hypothetical protein
MRQSSRPDNYVARFALDLDRLPMIQPWVEEIKIVPARVSLEPRVQVLINLRQALEASPVAANIGQ